MSKCVFIVNKNDAIPKYIDSVLNESGILLPGDNLVIAKCKYAKEMNGRNIKNVKTESRAITMPSSVGDKARKMSMKEFYSEYRPLKDHITRLDSLITPQKLIPKTKEGNSLRLYKLGKGKRKIFITGGVHAREWLSPATVSYVINDIIKNKNSKEWKKLLSENTYYIIPIVNPDGYKYTYKSDKRYYRKNRNGVDINRNFPIGFGGPGTSSNKNSDIYKGPKEFSEAESKAIRSIVQSNQFFIHLDVHSFAQVIAASWAYKEDDAPNNKLLKKYGEKMKDAMDKEYDYGHGSMNGRLGLSGGSLQDYTNSKGALSYTIELPPKNATGLGGFAPDSSIIIPTANDLLKAIQSISTEGKISTTLPISKSCASTTCKKGYECIEKQNHCVTQPCEPEVKCVKRNISYKPENDTWKFVAIGTVVILILYSLFN